MHALRLSATLLLALSAHAALAQQTPLAQVTSPDGKIAVWVEWTDEGAARYRVTRDGQEVLAPSRLGLVRDDADFTKGLRMAPAPTSEQVSDTYELPTIKRLHNTYKANKQTFHFTTADNKKLDIIFQVSNDGVAFRYLFPEQSTETRKINEEVTSFKTLPGTVAWLQPMSVAKTGFERTNPSYEENYQREIPVGTPSTLRSGWAFPALFRSGDTWIALSESGLGRNYCGTRLRHLSPEGEYSIGFPDNRESNSGKPGDGVTPESTLPWATPWRIIVIGDLKTVAESTLGTDVADKPSDKLLAALPKDAIQPGKASWSWPLLGDRQTTFDVQKRFIDYAADMGWKYTLIDALWDKQIGYDRIKELADYAKTKNVSLLLWYNSNGTANGAPQTPKDRMNTHESRLAEFKRLQEMGIKGLKIDFFGGDGQSVINYYHDILEDAAPFGLLLNFHGATVPRGWERTYPHLMTMESIKGLEFITFEQANADQEPTHAATIPFTRNLFDPMDFTPVALDRINNRIRRRTTAGFELALSVLFTSGIQHYAEIPQGMAKMPDYVKDFMKEVPTVWDDVKFLDGYPGKYVILARKGTPANAPAGTPAKWYIAAINAEPADKKLILDLSPFAPTRATLLTDGPGTGPDLFLQKQASITANKVDLTLKPNAGAVLIVE
jgi:hypothetical protein